MKEREVEPYWTKVAQKVLKGRKIVNVRYMSKKETEAMDWYKRTVVITLDNGVLIFPSMDDEGNDGGALFTTDKNNPTLPVI